MSAPQHPSLAAQDGIAFAPVDILGHAYDARVDAGKLACEVFDVGHLAARGDDGEHGFIGAPAHAQHCIAQQTLPRIFIVCGYAQALGGSGDLVEDVPRPRGFDGAAWSGNDGVRSTGEEP